jgi:hypothetical protein
MYWSYLHQNDWLMAMNLNANEDIGKVLGSMPFLPSAATDVLEIIFPSVAASLDVSGADNTRSSVPQARVILAFPSNS